MSERAKSYRELEIWQMGMEIAEATYRLTAEFPADERYGLVSQMRRASVSIPSNIAEGWGRNSQGNLAHFVRIARSSANELETQLELSVRLGLISHESDSVSALLNAFGRKSFNFMTKLEASGVREESATYNLDHAPFDI